MDEEEDQSVGEDQEGIEPHRDMSADEGQNFEDPDQLKGDGFVIDDLLTGVQSLIQGDQTPAVV